MLWSTRDCTWNWTLTFYLIQVNNILYTEWQFHKCDKLNNLLVWIMWMAQFSNISVMRTTVTIKILSKSHAHIPSIFTFETIASVEPEMFNETIKGLYLHLSYSDLLSSVIWSNVFFFVVVAICMHITPPNVTQ